MKINLGKVNKINGLNAALIAAAIIALVIIVFKIIDRVKESGEKRKTGSQNGADNNQTIQTASSEIDPNNLSFSDSEYSAMAQALYAAFQETGFWTSGINGVDEDVVYIQFRKLKTDDDVRKLIVVYGSKPIKKKNDSSSQDRSLPSTIAYMMASNEVKRINRILRGNDITYQF